MPETAPIPPVNINLDLTREKLTNELAELRQWPVETVGFTLPTAYNGDSLLLDRVKKAAPAGSTDLRYVGLNARLDDYTSKLDLAVDIISESPELKPDSITIHPNNNVGKDQVARLLVKCRDLGLFTIGYADTHRFPPDRDNSHSIDDEVMRASEASQLGYDAFLVTTAAVKRVSEELGSQPARSEKPTMKLIAQKFDGSLRDFSLLKSIGQAYENGASSIYIANSYFSREQKQRFMRVLLKIAGAH